MISFDSSVKCIYLGCLVFSALLLYPFISGLQDGSKAPALMFAIASSQQRDPKPLVALLLEHKADPNADSGSGTLVSWAALTGDSELLELMLEHRADLDAKDPVRLLFFAIILCFPEPDLESLSSLRFWCGLFQDGNTALHFAAKFESSQGNQENKYTDLLLNSRAEPRILDAVCPTLLPPVSLEFPS